MDIELPNPPTDTVSCLRFSPPSLSQTYLMAASWDKSIRIWEISNNGEIVPRLHHNLQAPILDSCWSNDGTKSYICGVDKSGYMWDIATNQMTKIAGHDAPIKTIRYIQGQSYTCVMTGGWDKKLKFWDLRTQNPMSVIELSDRIYCAAVHYPMAVVATGDRSVVVYNLENGPMEFRKLESQLKYQSRCISIFLDKNNSSPAGYALGSIEGRVGIQCLASQNPKDSFTFKCHRSQVGNNNTQDIFAVNDLAFHPVYQTLVTVGSDGKYTYWDKDARTKLKGSEMTEQQPITCGSIDSKGNIFAYAFGYDWSKGHEFNDPNKKPKIFIRPCNDEMRPQTKK